MSLVGHLVAENPSLAPYFDRLGIDYCCGGRNPLASACQARGLDVDEVLSELKDIEPTDAGLCQVDWLHATMSDLVDHIEVTHHDYLRRTLPRLAEMADRVVEAHWERHLELIDLRDIFTHLRHDLESHMEAEERIVFPALRRLDTAMATGDYECSAEQEAIAMMESEHDESGAALARMRALTDGFAPPEDACPTYRAFLAGLAEMDADLRRHVHMENHMLFPRARVAQAVLQSEAIHAVAP
jgi:regulator of cell morphogenesis and NO signaling